MYCSLKHDYVTNLYDGSNDWNFTIQMGCKAFVSVVGLKTVGLVSDFVGLGLDTLQS